MIQIHSHLSSDLWNNEELIPEIRKHLLNIAAAFYETLKIDVTPEDILLTGSAANYNYTVDSDVDLHLLINFNKITCKQELVKDFFLSKKTIWNDTHNIAIKNKPVEVYVQDTNETHESTGVYSILNNKWLIKPSVKNFYLQNFNKKEFSIKFNQIKDIIDYNLYKEPNLNYLKKIKKSLSNMRKKGLDGGGEMDIRNLIFKELRNRKYLDKITDAINNATDKKLSVESFTSFLYEKK